MSYRLTARENGKGGHGPGQMFGSLYRTLVKLNLPPTSTPAALQHREEEKRMEKEEVPEVPIQWRTSRRLQEATLKSLQKWNQLPPTQAVREFDESEKEIPENKTNSATQLPPSCINTGQKRRKQVHFANPVSVNIEEQKQINTGVPVSSVGVPLHQ
ncbi:hypothetical protein R1sor_006793 [Riccia sorocarpa]|uniref:Uncharacterized protein n=1 Tax=Riccia sorocarpa TaxID=122646 RepID=A0ABD3HRF8_9MARC